MPSIVESSMKTLAEAIAASNAADDAFEAAIKAAGYKSRWDWSKNFGTPAASAGQSDDSQAKGKRS